LWVATDVARDVDGTVEWVADGGSAPTRTVATKLPGPAPTVKAGRRRDALADVALLDADASPRRAELVVLLHP
jgi:hypothetical protein